MISIDKFKNKPLKRQSFKAIAVGLVVLYPLGGAGVSTAQAVESSANVAFMPLGREIEAPTAFLEMCTRSPVDCERTDKANDAQIAMAARQAIQAKYEEAFAHDRDPLPGAVSERLQNQHLLPSRKNNEAGNATSRSAVGEYSRVVFDDATKTALKAVNHRVNHTLIADTDAHLYKVDDYWDAPALVAGARGDCEDFALVKRRALIEQGIPAAALSLAIVRTRFDEDHAVLVVSTTQGDLVLDNLTDSIKPWQKTGYTWLSRQAPGDVLSWVSLGDPTTGKKRDIQLAAGR